MEVEQTGVVSVIRLLEQGQQALVHVRAVDLGQKLTISLDTPIFADPQEDDPVDGHLYGEVELAAGQSWVTKGNVVGQGLSPGLDLCQEGIVYLGGALLEAGGLGILVERPLQDRVVGEDGLDLVPLLGIIAV